MNKLLRKYWFLTGVSLLFFASASLAQTTTQITLTGVGDGATLGDVYVDPYTATVGGVTNTPVICDDWSDNTYLPETWTANVNTISTVYTGTSPLFAYSKTGNPNGTKTPGTLYAEAAYLASLLLNNTNSTQQGEISFALWELTYPYAPNPESTSPSQYLANMSSSLPSGFLNQVSYYLGQAAGETNFNTSGWEILTPNTNDSITCNGSGCQPPRRRNS